MSRLVAGRSLGAWSSRTVCAVGACALAMAIRLYRLGAESLWYDETVSAHLASLQSRALIAHTALDIHPPGYYLLLRLWSQLAGDSEFALAFLSLMAGVLLVAGVHRLTRSIAGPSAGSLAGVLTALSAYSVWYSQEVRMYTVAALLLLGLAAATMQIVSGDSRPLWAAVWAILAAAALYTLYYSLFLLPALSLAWLLYALRETAMRRHRLLAWLGSHALLLLLYLPWLPTAVRQALDPPVPPWRSTTPWLTALAQGANALAFGESAPASWWPLSAVLVLTAVLSIARCSRGRRRSFWPAPAFIAPWALLLAASAIQPLFHPRYLFPFSAFFLASLAISLGRLASGARGRVLAAALLAVFVGGNVVAAQRIWTEPQYRADDLRGAVDRLAQEWLPEDIVLINAGYTYTAFMHYWPGEIDWIGRVSEYRGARAERGPVVLQGGSLGAAPDLGWGHPSSDFYATTLTATIEGISRALRANGRLWVIRLYDTVTDPSGKVRQWLEQSLVPLSDDLIPGPSYGRLQSFAPRTNAMPCASPIAWGDVAASCTRTAGVVDLGGNRRVPVYLHVRQMQLPPGSSLHYTLRLQGPSGETEAQQDGQLTALVGTPVSDPAPVVLNGIALGIPVDAPVGEYGIRLGLYILQADRPIPLPPADAAGTSVAGPDGLMEIGRMALP